jgi:hypothetical protein
MVQAMESGCGAMWLSDKSIMCGSKGRSAQPGTAARDTHYENMQVRGLRLYVYQSNFWMARATHRPVKLRPTEETLTNPKWTPFG